MPSQKITVQGFLSEFVRQHETMPDRPFCWILGSGASVESGIPTGGTLVMQWLKELHEMEDFKGVPFETWATEENLGIKGFTLEKAAGFYPWIYQRRYHNDQDSGYAFLEKVMDAAEPSYGYSVLAQIMADTRHKIAITTNFDNLIGDALSIYTEAFPLVCGHESLTGYIRANMRRPLIAKIHRDLLLNPLNEPSETATLPDGWDGALKLILANYTPIVIGYGGNDGSLMGFLKSLEPVNGGIFWCYLAGVEPTADIDEVVRKHHGKLVPVAGFDELMLQMWEKLKLESPIKKAQAAHERRVRDFQSQFEALNKKLKEPAETGAAEKAREPVREAAAAAVERLTKEKDWWAWQLKANAEPDPNKAEKIYREALEDFPNSANLIGNFAVFMQDIRQDYDAAEKLYRKALELDPKHANNTGNFARFIQNIRRDYDAAEKLYRKALELDPKHANHTGNFAVFMEDIRKDYDEAERLYRKALELDPKHANNTGNFARFIQNIRRDYDAAEKLYRKALELDPKHANNTGNFAVFMQNIRKDYDEAERLYRKALELDPKHANHTGNFAVFMRNIRKDYDEAERLFRKALELDPKHANNTGNFAVFMQYVRKNYPKANEMYRLALELEPNSERMRKNYDDFLKEHPEFKS